MAPDCPNLDLSPHWACDGAQGDIVLVRGMDAIRLCKGGRYKKVSAQVTIAQLRRMSRTLERDMSDFLALTTTDMPGGRAATREEMVRELVDNINHDILVGVRPPRGAARWEDDLSDEDRMLVLEIENGMRGHVHHGGRRYKLVAGPDLVGVPERNSYEIVGKAEAERVLEAMAQQHAAQVALAKSLRKAAGKLSPDWRPPLTPKGIVLLRKVAVRPAASHKPSPAITPSQMRAMMAEPAAVITYLEVPEYIASGSETVALRYGFSDPNHRLRDVVLEIFTDGDRTAPIWKRSVPADHVTAGQGHLDWDGEVDSNDDEFPDGFATLASSPYVVRLSAKHRNGSQLREARIRVEVAEIKLAFAPVECLTDAAEREVLQGMSSLAQSNTVKLRARSFMTAGSQAIDLGDGIDVGHQMAMAPWGNGAGVRIPLTVTVAVWDSLKQPKRAGKALGCARVLWDFVEDAPGTALDGGFCNSSYLRAIEQHDQANARPPGGRNTPVILGGKRGSKTTFRPVFVGPDAQVKDFPFTCGAAKTRFWAAFGGLHRDGEHEAQAGAVFRPSAIAGDAYAIKAYVDVDGTLDTTDPIDAGRLHAQTSRFEVAREVSLVRWVRKSAEVTVELSDISQYTLPASLHFVDRCPNRQEILGKAEYLAAVQSALAANLSSGPDAQDAIFDRHSLLPLADQYDRPSGFFTRLFGGPEREPRNAMLNFRTFDEFIDVCEEDRSLDQTIVGKLKDAGEQEYIGRVSKRALALSGYVARALAVAGGISVVTFSDLHNLGYCTVAGFAAGQLVDRSRCTIALFRNGADTLAHELGHCLFLPHAPTSPGSGIKDVVESRHTAGNDLCLMSYARAPEGFCAICLLRLRGADGGHLNPGGLVP